MIVSIDEIGIVFGIVVSLFSLYTSVVKNAKEAGRISMMVDTMWDFQIRRAQTELIKKGLGEINSTFKVSKEAKLWMAPLVGPIRDFYQRIGRQLSERELYVEIEQRFGDRILKEVCIPHGLDQGACLLIAVQAVLDNH
jgi:tetrahydromethanopterin S-methyltransferase subunit G